MCDRWTQQRNISWNVTFSHVSLLICESALSIQTVITSSFLIGRLSYLSNLLPIYINIYVCNNGVVTRWCQLLLTQVKTHYFLALLCPSSVWSLRLWSLRSEVLNYVLFTIYIYICTYTNKLPASIRNISLRLSVVQQTCLDSTRSLHQQYVILLLLTLKHSRHPHHRAALKLLQLEYSNSILFIQGRITTSLCPKHKSTLAPQTLYWLMVYSFHCKKKTHISLSLHCNPI